MEEVKKWAWRAVRGQEDLLPLPEHASHELLPGWSDSWLIEPREELRLLQLHALEATAQRMLKDRRLAEACICALAAVYMDPFRESAARLLIEIHLREGNTVEAVHEYRWLEQLLKAEINSQPGPTVTALVAPFIAVQNPSLHINRLSKPR